MTAKDMVEQINYLINTNNISSDDEVVLIGTGDKKSNIISGILIPKVKFSNINDVISDNKGYYSIGFTNLMDYDDNYNTDIKTIFENTELVHKNIGKPNL